MLIDVAFSFLPTQSISPQKWSLLQDIFVALFKKLVQNIIHLLDFLLKNLPLGIIA